MESQLCTPKLSLEGVLLRYFEFCGFPYLVIWLINLKENTNLCGEKNLFFLPVSTDDVNIEYEAVNCFIILLSCKSLVF